MTAPCPRIVTSMYLGKPGAMQNITIPDSGYGSTGGRGEALQTAISGVGTITRVPTLKRAWALPYGGLTDDTANLLTAFYLGAMGIGPFVLVDPAWRNKLTDSASAMGAKYGALTPEWAATVGTLTYDTSVAAPVAGSSNLRWAGAGVASKLGIGAWSGGLLVPRSADAPVYLSDLGTVADLYVRTASGTASVTLNCNGLNAAGTVSLAGSSATATVSSTGWTRLTSYLAAGSATALYVLPTLTCNTAAAPNILVCCADVQYGVTSPTAAPAWVLGLGSPRITMNGPYPQTMTKLPYRAQAFTLVEAA